MVRFSYGESENGEFEFVSLTKEKLEESVDLPKSSFFMYANTSVALGMPNNPLAREELSEICRKVAKDGISIIAIHKNSGQVAGYSFNKIMTNDASIPSIFETHKLSCTQQESLSSIEFIQQCEKLCDLYKLCNVDCLLDLMFVGTKRKFWGKGIGFHLIRASIEAGRRLHAGDDVRVPVDGTPLMEVEKPKIATALFTSYKTQKIGKKLGFVVALKIPSDGFEVHGKKLEVFEDTPFVTVEYKDLK